MGKTKVESCRAIDVNYLHRKGCLRSGTAGTTEWNSDGERVAWIRFRSEEGRIVFSYNHRRGNEDWESIEEAVQIVRVPCRFGGERPYFLCPGVVNGIGCGRRVVKLYGADRYFLCRHCYRLAYASQSEPSWDRAMRRANKIRRRLGGEPGACSLFPKRPKGMWQRTYDRLFDEAIAAESEADTAFEMRAARLVAQIDRRQSGGSFW